MTVNTDPYTGRGTAGCTVGNAAPRRRAPATPRTLPPSRRQSGVSRTGPTVCASLGSTSHPEEALPRAFGGSPVPNSRSGGIADQEHSNGAGAVAPGERQWRRHINKMDASGTHWGPGDWTGPPPGQRPRITQYLRPGLRPLTASGCRPAPDRLRREEATGRDRSGHDNSRPPVPRRGHTRRPCRGYFPQAERETAMHEALPQPARPGSAGPRRTHDTTVRKWMTRNAVRHLCGPAG